MHICDDTHYQSLADGVWSIKLSRWWKWVEREKWKGVFILAPLICLPFIPPSLFLPPFHKTGTAWKTEFIITCSLLWTPTNTCWETETLTGSWWSSKEMALRRILVRPSSWESTLISLCLGDFTSTLDDFIGDPYTGVAGSEVPDSPLDLFSESS